MIVNNLSNSFNPVPKNKVEKKKEVITIKKKSKKLAKLEKNRFRTLLFMYKTRNKKYSKRRPSRTNRRQK